MLAVVDSGSTKADWLIADQGKIVGLFHTIGFNPFFHSKEFVFETLNNHSELAPFTEAITELKFFGAGCSSAERNKIIYDGLKQFFPKAHIVVDHDMLACAYATCGDEAGIPCIIGTGSNSCFYDGKEVYSNNYGLGFILGDEASGSYFGKKILTHYLYNMLPKHITEDFYASYQLDKNIIINHVYKMPNANVWLASFATFLSKHKDDPYIIEMVDQGLKEFFNLYVLQYPNCKEVPVHFVGSLSFCYSNEIKAIAAENNIKIGKIIKQPIHDLMDYYLKK